MSPHPILSRKVVGCCDQLFNNHKYELLPFEVISARPNKNKYPDTVRASALVGCHNCGWFNVKWKARFTRHHAGRRMWDLRTCPTCGHLVQFANLSREQCLLLAP